MVTIEKQEIILNSKDGTFVVGIIEGIPLDAIEVRKINEWITYNRIYWERERRYLEREVSRYRVLFWTLVLVSNITFILSFILN